VPFEAKNRAYGSVTELETETRWSDYQEINIAPSILDSEADNQLSGL
jgi:hypothetical protein